MTGHLAVMISCKILADKCDLWDLASIYGLITFYFVAVKLFFFLKFFQITKNLHFITKKLIILFEYCSIVTMKLESSQNIAKILFVPKNFVPSLQIRLKSGWARKPILAAKAPIF